MIASRSYTLCPPTTLWIDTEALKRNIVHVVKEIRGDSVFESEDTSSSDVLALQEFGMACHSVVAVVNPETRTVCAPYEAGEIWVSSSWAGPGGLEGFRLQNDPTGQIFYRTGERAFFWPVPKDMGAPDDACGWTGLVDAGRPYSLSLFVIGPYEREIVVNGLRFCLEDLEQTAESCFEWIAPSGCVIFPHKGSVICVAEIQNEAMFINASSRIALALLRKHRLMVDTIAFMKKGMLAKSRLQEKQRGKVAMAYHMGKLPVIHYVHLSPAKP